MIPGSNQSPYRLPCSGTTMCANGPRYQHGTADEKNIPVYLYYGTVPNYTGDGSYIAPYERFNAANECDADPSPCQGYDDCSPNDNPPCLVWIDPGSDADCQYASLLDVPGATVAGGALTYDSSVWYRPQMLTAATPDDAGENYQVGDALSVNGGTLSTYVGQGSGAATVVVSKVNPDTGAVLAVTVQNPGSYSNIADAALPASPNSVTGGHGTGATLDLTWGNQTMSMLTCFKYGFKNVQALRQWHGQPGYFFNTGELGIWQCPSDEDGDLCYYYPYTVFNYDATQSKYTSITTLRTGTLMQTLADTYTYDGSYGGTWELNPQTGVISVDSINYAPCTAQYSNGIPGAYNPQINMLAYDAGLGIPGLSSNLGAYSTPAGVLAIILNLSTVTLNASSQTFSCSDTSWTITVEEDEDYPYTTPATLTGSWSLGEDAVSGSLIYNGPILEPQGVQAYYSFSFSFSDSTFTYEASNSGWYGDDIGTAYGSVSFSSTLSGSNSNTDVQTDIGTLLDTWDLTDDTKYPWRADGNTSIAPLVTRNEVPGNVDLVSFAAWTEDASEPIDDCNGNAPDSPDWTPTYAYVPSVDPNAAICDGSIVGSPMPAGYQGLFDFAFQDFQICETFTPPALYINGWGQSVYDAPAGIPLNATQWTNNQIAVQYGPGAWIFYNHNPSWNGCTGTASAYDFDPQAVCIAQKWAETKMAFPSQNFFRPAGSDRFAYDENNVYSITATTNGTDMDTIGPGSQITLEVTFDCAAASLASTSGLWGGPAVGGFYEIASAADNVVTLGTLVYTVPSNWTSSGYTYDSETDTSTSDSAYTFGLLRFSTGNPSTDPPAILGRAGISTIAEYEMEADVMELTTDSLPTLGMIQGSNDAVDIYDGQMNLLSGNLAVTRIDDSHFTVPVAVSTLTGAAWLMSHGAPDYYWNDQYPKGDFAYTDWTWSPRQICEAVNYNAVISACASDSAEGEYLYGDDCSGCPTDTQTVYEFPISAFTQEAACLPFTPCSPAVICISPSSEDFDNGTTYDFSTIDFDEQYGSGWQAQIQQVMEDLLYQAPHFPAQGPSCTPGPFAWLADDGSCESNTDLVTYYPHAPMVECRLTLPDGAPALPSAGICCGVENIVLGWSTPVGVLQGAEQSCTGTPGTDCYPNNTLLPPGANGLGYSSFNVWNLWQNLCGCVDDSGKFASTYQNEVLGCT